MEAPPREPAPCFHGGRFFEAVGVGFDRLERRTGIINADVLDAWFEPAPGVVRELTGHLPWLVRTSPPADCAGLVKAIATAREVGAENIVLGAGSSDLIFRTLREWLSTRSRVLLLDPTYGEYAHVLEKVIGCTVERFPLARAEGYVVNLARLNETMERGYDLVVLVNPNSPSGRHIPRAEMEALLRRVPASTRIWIDETYVEYAGRGESLERFAAGSRRVVVCKSMSKVYALSGLRSAYLCGEAGEMKALRAITPPWVVSLPGQVAAVRALEDPGYYAERYRETQELRAELALELASLDWEVVPGTANFLLCHVPENGPDAAEWVHACEARGLFLRNASAMGTQLGRHAIRIAVKDGATNRRMVEILQRVAGA